MSGAVGQEGWARGRVAPVAVLLLGALFVLALQTTIPDEVFFSGDGGLKALMTRQLAAGEWHADLRLSAEPWLAGLWQQGLYPFAPPFAYTIDGRHYIQYPLPYLALSAPFYAALGWRGLYVPSLLGVVLAWAGFLVGCRRRGLSPAASAAGLAVLVFATPLSAYGAMLWEHALAVGLSVCGLAAALPDARRGGSPRSEALGAALLGLAVWMRPESVCVLAGAVLALPLLGVPRRRWLAFGAVAGLVVAGFLALNLALYGSLAGMHGVQSVEPTEVHLAHQPPLAILARALPVFLCSCPLAFWVLGLALAGLRWRALRPRRADAALWLVLGVYLVGAPLLLPNAGGKQFGARYFLHLLPLVCWLAAAQLDALRRVGRPLATVALAAGLLLFARGVWLDGVGAWRTLSYDYGHRVLPALERVRRADVALVAVQHQWMAQDLEAAIPGVPFARVRNEAELELAVRALAARGERRFLWLHWKDPGTRELHLAGHRIRLELRGFFGSYVFLQGLVLPEREAPAATPPPA